MSMQKVGGKEQKKMVRKKWNKKKGDKQIAHKVQDLKLMNNNGYFGGNRPVTLRCEGESFPNQNNQQVKGVKIFNKNIQI